MTTSPLMACGASPHQFGRVYHLRSQLHANTEKPPATGVLSVLSPPSSLLFTEMYGFPLTIYLLSGWLQSRFPQVDWYSHDAGHLLEMIFGWRGNPHFRPFHILSSIAAALGTLLAAVENAG